MNWNASPQTFMPLAGNLKAPVGRASRLSQKPKSSVGRASRLSQKPRDGQARRPSYGRFPMPNARCPMPNPPFNFIPISARIKAKAEGIRGTQVPWIKRNKQVPYKRPIAPVVQKTKIRIELLRQARIAPASDQPKIQSPSPHCGQTPSKGRSPKAALII